MISPDDLKSLLAKREYSRSEKVLLTLAAGDGSPEMVKAIRNRAVASGLRAAERWNLSQLLSDLEERAVRVAGGWELTQEGKASVEALAGSMAMSRTKRVAAGLRHHLSTIPREETRGFVLEAIECLEAKLLRAAAVLSWVGAIGLLQDQVVSHHLSAFNAEAMRRDAKWKAAKNRDDLATMKEFDLLHILESISVLGKSQKQELLQCLKLRNGCGHPNSLRVGEARIAGHVESLILNVFVPFAS